MSDDELLQTCGRRLKHKVLQSPPLFWESEIYGFGSCIRKLTGLSSYTPLVALSDHGVTASSKLWPNEMQLPSVPFLTWNKAKAQRMTREVGRQTLHVPHPYVDVWGLRNKGSQSAGRGSNGSVFFLPHSNQYGSYPWDIKLIAGVLRELPAQMQPIKLCVQMHDVVSGRFRSLRVLRYPIVTAGNSMNPRFQDRLRRIILSHDWIISSSIGSQVFYALAAGKGVFMTDLVNATPSELAASQGWTLDDHEYFVSESEYQEFLDFREHLRCFEGHASTEVQSFARRALGFDSTMKWPSVRRVLVRSLITNKRIVMKRFSRAAIGSLMGMRAEEVL